MISWWRGYCELIFTPKVFLAICCSALLMLFARPGFDYWYLAWFSFVPILWASHNRSPLAAFCIAQLSFWLALLVAFSWTLYLAENYFGLSSPFHYLFLLLFTFYISLSLGAAFFFARYISDQQYIPYFLSVPVVCTAIWILYPFLFDFGLAETQMPFPVLLQALDLFGSEAMIFCIVLFNGLIFALLLCLQSLYRQKCAFKKMLLAVFPAPFWVTCVGAIFGGLFCIGWLIYGLWQYPIWQNKSQRWPTTNIGLLQPNRVAGFRSSQADEGLTELFELTATRKLQQLGAQIVLWPEGNVYSFSTDLAGQRFLQSFVEKLQIHLLFSDNYRQKKLDQWNVYNAVVWLKPDGSEGAPYFKRILVPFGEYIPLGFLFSGLLETLGVRFSDFSPGEQTTIFDTGSAVLIPLICYESLYGNFVAEQAKQPQKGRILFTLSQDGWYDSELLTSEHSQIAQLRAIENRLSLLHNIQNGFSSLVTAAGDVLDKTPYKQRGYWVFAVPTSPEQGWTFFQSYPWVTRSFIFLMLFICGLSVFWSKRSQKKP